ncbi:MAG TPA: hypothetical protein VGD68_05945 [Streptosporangiaceae bacterium]
MRECTTSQLLNGCSIICGIVTASTRPRAGVEGDAAILRFPERQDYPAERLAADDAVSDFGGSAVLVTRFAEGGALPDGAEKFTMMGVLLGRLHALPYDETAARPGGSSGEDPSREGAPVRTCWRPRHFSTPPTPRCQPPSVIDSSGSGTWCARLTALTASRKACFTETSCTPPITPS